jgi:hypothetical protein
MTDTTRLSRAAVEAEAAALAALLDGGSLCFYDGTQPLSVDSPVLDQAKLAELRFAVPAAASVEGGAITFAALEPDVDARASGVASWFRAFAADGTPVWDGSVGPVDATITLPTASIVQHAEIDLTSLRLTVTRG